MHKKLYHEDIIFSRATPPGSSAIAIIRVSGKNSFTILNQIISNKKNQFNSHRVYRTNIVENNTTIDDVIVITFAEGKSFTGEESFEINCHGSEVIISIIYKLLINNGCRIAEAGEFSKRAFLNNKIDLTKAEAIMDLVNSSTTKSAKTAMQQLSGRLTSTINSIKALLLELLSEIEVYIDYPEEDLTIDTEKWTAKVNKIIDAHDILLKDYDRGQYLRSTLHVALLGKTNSGKSTLFNYLLNEDKAIVSDIHGTTRDYIDGLININGYGIRLYDTAGLRYTEDPIEKEGTKRSNELSQRSDIVIYVIDGNAGLTQDDISNVKNIPEEKKILFIINKSDLINEEKSNILKDEVAKELSKKFEKYSIIFSSALQKKGIEQINNGFLTLLFNESSTDAVDPILTNSRHADLLNQSKKALGLSVENLHNQILDLSAFDIRESLDKIGEITGEVSKTDVINNIFKNFCVGK